MKVRVIAQDTGESDLFVKPYIHGKAVLRREQQAKVDSDTKWKRQTRQNRGTMFLRLRALDLDDRAHRAGID